MPSRTPLRLPVPVLVLFLFLFLLPLLSTSVEGRVHTGVELIPFEYRPFMSRKPFFIDGATSNGPDSYRCSSVAMPYMYSLFLSKFEPFADSKMVHHMILYGCSDRESDAAVWDCSSMASICKTGVKPIILYGWANGAETTTLPPDTAFHIGKDAAMKYLVLQVHYAHAFGYADTSTGIFLYITRAPSTYHAGLIATYSSDITLVQSDSPTNVPIVCTYNHDEPVTAFAYRVHAHSLGKNISATLIRGSVKTPIGWADPNAAEGFHTMSSPLTLSKGDIIRVNCQFDTHSMGGQIIHAGTASSDEMCNFYIMFNATALDGSFFCGNGQSALFVSNHVDEIDYWGQDITECLSSFTCPPHQVMHAIANGKYCCLDPPIVDWADLVVQRQARYWGDLDQLVSFERPFGLVSRWPNYWPLLSNYWEDQAYVFDVPNSSSTLTNFVIPPDATPTPSASPTASSPATTTAAGVWPLSLPEPFTLGQVSALFHTQQNEEILWVLHRGRRVWDGDTFNETTNEILYDTPIDEDVLVAIHTETGTKISSWGKGLFYLPHGLTIDEQGNFWITDVGLHQVFCFDKSLPQTPKLVLGMRLEPGSDTRHFCKPAEAGANQDGTIWVADGYCNSRVMLFSATGEFKASHGIFGDDSDGRLPPAGHFSIPHSLAFDRNGFVYVADRENGRVQVFNPNGELVRYYHHKNWYQVYAVRYISAQHLISVAVTCKPFGSYALVYNINIDDGFIWDIFGEVDDTDFASPLYSLSLPHALAVGDSRTEIYVGDHRPIRLLRIGAMLEMDPEKNNATFNMPNHEFYTINYPGQGGLSPPEMHTHDCDRLLRTAIETPEWRLHVDCSCGLNVISAHPEICVSGDYCLMTGNFSQVLGAPLLDMELPLHDRVPVFMSRHTYDGVNHLFLTYAGASYSTGRWFISYPSGNRLYSAMISRLPVTVCHSAIGNAFDFPSGMGENYGARIFPFSSSTCLSMLSVVSSTAAPSSTLPSDSSTEPTEIGDSTANAATDGPTLSSLWANPTASPNPKPSATTALPSLPLEDIPAEPATSSFWSQPLVLGLLAAGLLSFAVIIAIAIVMALKKRHRSKDLKTLYRNLKRRDPFTRPRRADRSGGPASKRRGGRRDDDDDDDDDDDEEEVTLFEMKAVHTPSSEAPSSGPTLWSSPAAAKFSNFRSPVVTGAKSSSRDRGLFMRESSSSEVESSLHNVASEDSGLDSDHGKTSGKGKKTRVKLHSKSRRSKSALQRFLKLRRKKRAKSRELADDDEDDEEELVYDDEDNEAEEDDDAEDDNEDEDDDEEEEEEEEEGENEEDEEEGDADQDIDEEGGRRRKSRGSVRKPNESVFSRLVAIFGRKGR